MVQNFIVAEYSVAQDCFHVHDLRSMLQHNIENMVEKHDSDWLPIGVFEKEREAHEYIELIREQMKIQKANWANDTINKIIKGE